ncbi:hypothetical protein BH23BAC2_BH23BAC2_01510 [soil metagenome]
MTMKKLLKSFLTLKLIKENFYGNFNSSNENLSS